jgi:hypothetical protein
VKTKVSEKVTEGFFGEGNRGYLLKTIHRYKGKGAPRVIILSKLPNMFKRIIHAGNDHHKLP